MTIIPTTINGTVESIYRKWEETAGERKPRYHLGFSLLGHHCDRYIWLEFRWVRPEKYPGRILRLFWRGEEEEKRIVADLTMIGCDVTLCLDKQKHMPLGCHVGGSADGIIESGLPEAPKTRHVLEAKTHSTKSFGLLKDGVEKAHKRHFIQCQANMFAHNIDRGLYFAVCKENDSLYTERIYFDAAIASRYIERGQLLALEQRLPGPLSDDPAWWQCKMCSYYSWCHQDEDREVKKSCRTCAFSTPTSKGCWICARFPSVSIPKEHQLTGCKHYMRHPDL